MLLSEQIEGPGNTVMASATLWFLPMNFPARLIQVRKSRGLTQQEWPRPRRCTSIRFVDEAGSAPPTLEALTRLAQTRQGF